MKRLLTSLAIIAITSGGAAAQDEARQDGPYFRVGAGVTAVSDWTQEVVYDPAQPNPLPGLVGGNGLSVPIFLPDGNQVVNGNGFIAGAALGFDYADGIRTELEYRYASSSIDGVTQTWLPEAMFRSTLPQTEDKIGAHFVMSNFYFDFYNDSPITPFIGGGVGGALVANERGDRDAALAYQGRAGLSFAIGGGFSADLEYIYLRTNRLVFGPKLEDLTTAAPLVPNISGDRYESSSAMISLRKPF